MQIFLIKYGKQSKGENMDRLSLCDITECPITYALGMIGGKWHLPIIYLLSKNNVARYNELKKCLLGITNMMLSQSLKELEANGIVNRRQYPEIPPRVEYSLTQNGLALMPMVDELAKWGEAQMETRRNARSEQETV
jgi:DNA-binding HxlR family transcriptional regulator